MNEETRKMTPEKVNIDNCELDDEQLSQAVGGADGDPPLGTTLEFVCQQCRVGTPHTWTDIGYKKTWICDVCGDARGLLMVGSDPRNRHNA
ncbi:MAG: hypothetical protein IJX67_04150 [Oscillospiraceae bacterium]|nr:hypothetical protein [Oscillospiraceae bacterium]